MKMSEKFKAGWPSVADGVKSGWLSHAICIKDEPYKGAHWQIYEGQPKNLH